MVFAVLPRKPDSNQRSSMANTEEIRKNPQKMPKAEYPKNPEKHNEKNNLLGSFHLIKLNLSF